MIGQTGADAAAQPITSALSGVGVDTSLVAALSGAPTGQALILLQPGGENSIVIIGGANQAWPETEPLSEGARRAIGGAAMLCLQREVPERVNVAAATAARAARVPVLLDAGGVDAPLTPELLALVDVLSPNETELARLTGLATSDEASIVAAARSLLAKGVSAVLVSVHQGGSDCWPLSLSLSLCVSPHQSAR